MGATAESGAGSGGSDTLRVATVPIVTDSGCAVDYGVYFNSSTMVCAGYTQGGIDTCFGDSGGPMQAAMGGGYRLVGITSWGAGCAQPNAPGVYTRVAGDGLRSAVASTVFNLETAFGLPHDNIIGAPPPPNTTTPEPPTASTCKGKPATIVGTSSNDVRSGTPGRDVIVGLAGNDELTGLAGKDLLCGGRGKDKLNGGKSKDTCIGGKANDSALACEVEKSI